MRILRHALQRLLTAIFAVLLIASPMQPALHTLLAPHVFCAEHQALEHDTDASQDGGDDADDRTGSDGAHGHGDFCVFPGTAFEAVPDTPGPVDRTAAVDATPAPTPLVDAAAPRAPPLAYAPKTSPPFFS
jgi:hypothetical protein